MVTCVVAYFTEQYQRSFAIKCNNIVKNGSNGRCIHSSQRGCEFDLTDWGKFKGRCIRPLGRRPMAHGVEITIFPSEDHYKPAFFTPKFTWSRHHKPPLRGGRNAAVPAAASAR